MKMFPSRRLVFRQGLLPLIVAASLSTGSAQPASLPATATELAKYDANKNGVLDPGELAALEAGRRRSAPVVGTGTSATSGETIVLSPFEVVADTRGYQATNTMAGTRINTKLEDLGASIEVVTKEQMADFAMLDINDVFLYTGNTEGTGTYNTLFEANTNNGSSDDMTMQDPNNANRIRGLSQANVSLDGFETSNRVPLDPLDSDGVEISRGPNANIFGVGEPGGTVNIVGASANLQRDKSQVSFRGDSFDGYRGSLDVNRVLLQDQLAVRVTGVYQHDGFHLKPSGVDTKRYSGYVQFRPFKQTKLTASYQDYSASGQRANSVPPIDGVSYWESLGSPTWDPITATVHGGAQHNQIFSGTANPDGFFIQNGNYSQLFVDRAGLDYWSANYGVSGADPTSGSQRNRRLLVTNPFRDTDQPLMSGLPQISARNLYDYTSINLAAPNYFKDETQTARVSLEQNIFNTGRQSLDLQLAWFRESSERYTRYLLGVSNAGVGGNTGRLLIDPVERLLDGTPNPYFLRPFIQAPEAQSTRNPWENNSYRGQFAYKFDFTGNQGFTRWLGAHNLVGYGEYKDRTSFTLKFKDNIVNNPPWLAGVIRAGQGLTSNPVNNNNARTSYRFYLGDRSGDNIDYAPGTPAYGNYTYVWGNAVTGAMHYEPVTLGEAASGSTPGNFSGTHQINKTGGLLLQSRFLQGRVITTFGRREDQIFTERTLHPNSVPDLYDAYGMQFNFDGDLYGRSWIQNAEGGRDWVVRKGKTETNGAVVKPFRGWPVLDRAAERGPDLTRFFADALRGLSFHYNESNSKKPTEPAVTITREILPDPVAKGKDYGFSLLLFDGKLSLRVNKYDTRTFFGRGGPSASLAGTLNRLDFNYFEGDLESASRTWLSAANPSWTTAQLDTAVEKVLGIPLYPAGLTGFAITEADQQQSKGHEIELNYNPTSFWTMRASVAENVAIQATLSENLQKWLDQRMPVWTSVIDPRNTDDPATPQDERLWWYGTVLVAQGPPAQFFNTNFVTGYATAKSLEGLYRPQLSRYSGNVSTNFRLAGITDHSILKRFNIGGALRYQGSKTIGYYGKQQLPAIITEIDVNRPIDLKAVVYVDAFIGYRTRIWRDKIGATVQLNVRNLGESARLVPTLAWPDGTKKTFRIAVPQQFILTTTFDL